MGELKNDVFSSAINLMRYLSQASAECNAYLSHWGAEYVCKQINERFDNVKKEAPYNDQQFWKNVFNLPEEQKLILGFMKWDENIKEMCIPLWIWQCLPDEMVFEGKLKKDLDNTQHSKLIKGVLT